LSLASLDKIAPREVKPTLKIDISKYVGVEATLDFREPKASDLFPRADAQKKLKISFPEFPDQMVQIIMVMGRCYVPQADDGSQFDPYRQICKLARDHGDIYLYVVNTFAEAFPLDISSAVDSVPNE
jgi:hypothetical protein